MTVAFPLRMSSQVAPAAPWSNLLDAGISSRFSAFRRVWLKLDTARSTMITEEEMSPNDDNPEEVKKAQKKYLWFGYGGYSGPGEAGAFNPANIRADTGILDKLLEIFGIKEKTKKEREEDKK